MESWPVPLIQNIIGLHLFCWISNNKRFIHSFNFQVIGEDKTKQNKTKTIIKTNNNNKKQIKTEREKYKINEIINLRLRG